MICVSRKSTRNIMLRKKETQHLIPHHHGKFNHHLILLNLFKPIKPPVADRALIIINQKSSFPRLHRVKMKESMMVR